MPTYEYRCPKGHEFELFQSMSEEPRIACTECGEMAQRLLSGGAGLIFKGEGFYTTDYRSEEYKKAASSDKEATSSEKKGSDGDSGEKSSGSGLSDGDGGTSGGSSESKGTSSGASKGSGRSGSSGPSKSSSVSKSSSSE
ncbi:MAG TPA: FmdB family transcriptional regulator, partial [Gemmatimonadetes bacterium]|nr:FmdB family transcriptional regulator [Gemmatimonadota bacterium]